MDTPPRRNFLAGWLSTVLAAVFPARALAGAPVLQESGTPVTTHLVAGNPDIPPLDTTLLFARGDNNNGTAITHEVLSLIHQENGTHSYPWTLYASLETHHEVGDGCVVCSRLHKYGPGWSAGLHSEIFAHNRAVTLGVNVETTNEYSGTEKSTVVGVNIQAKGPHPSRYGIQIQDGGNHYETAIALNGTGAIGLDTAGKYAVGLHVHDNPIRLNEGACVELDGSGQIRLRYHAGRIEFLNGDKCFGHLDVNGDDHAL